MKREKLIYGIFLLLGLVTIGAVLLITIYLIVSGIPAIRQIGIVDFLFGTKWESTASPSIIYGLVGMLFLIVNGKQIDNMEREIETICLKLLLFQQPVARDLRQVSAALKMIWWTNQHVKRDKSRYFRRNYI